MFIFISGICYWWIRYDNESIDRQEMCMTVHS